MEIGFSIREGAVGVELPEFWRSVVSSSAELVETILNSPDSPGYSRISGPIDVAVDYDDPLVALERQMAMESLTEMVVRTSQAEILTPEEAEAWLKVLSMACVALASSLGVIDEESLNRLDPGVKAHLGLFQALQSQLLSVLDA